MPASIFAFNASNSVSVICPVAFKSRKCCNDQTVSLDPSAGLKAHRRTRQTKMPNTAIETMSTSPQKIACDVAVVVADNAELTAS